jgi:hypothetical protein
MYICIYIYVYIYIYIYISLGARQVACTGSCLRESNRENVSGSALPRTGLDVPDTARIS